MTEGPGLEPWLANGFPPPSFVVETERVAVAVGGAGPPLQSRLLVGGAILGAILLVSGLILLARGGGDDQTALNSAPATPTSSIPVVTFPPATVFEDSFLVPQETVPTLPVAPQTPIFPITPQPPAPGPAAGTTQPPAPTTKKPGTSTTLQSNPTSIPTTTSTSTPPPPTPPSPSGLSVEPAGPTFRVQDSDPCAVDWKIRAIVSSTSPIESVKVQSNGTSDGAPLVKVVVSGEEVWQVQLRPIGRPAEVTFRVVVTTKDGQLPSREEKVDCL